MSWSLNGNTISSNDTISISMSGNYVLMVTDSNSCVSTDTVSIIINPAPQPVVTFINDQLICTNVNNVNYEWYMNGQSVGTNSDTLTLHKTDGIGLSQQILQAAWVLIQSKLSTCLPKLFIKKYMI